MAPQLIEVPADQKDFAEDVLKAAVMLFTGYALNTWVFKRQAQFIHPTQELVAAIIAGLFIHHFIVDKNVLRFVVKSGQEGYYCSKKRFN